MKILLYFLVLVAIAVVFWWFPPIFAICVALYFYVMTEDLD